MGNSNENKKEDMILVPERWFKSLLENANDFESAFNKYQFGNHNNDTILQKGVMLMGYAKSASSILKSNKRVSE